MYFPRGAFHSPGNINDTKTSLVLLDRIHFASQENIKKLIARYTVNISIAEALINYYFYEINKSDFFWPVLFCFSQMPVVDFLNLYRYKSPPGRHFSHVLVSFVRIHLAPHEQPLCSVENKFKKKKQRYKMRNFMVNPTFPLKLNYPRFSYSYKRSKSEICIWKLEEISGYGIFEFWTLLFSRLRKNAYTYTILGKLCTN